MMLIPTDLPPELAPVAWVLGAWKGWGMLATPGEDRPVVEEVHADIVGTHLRLVTTVRAASLPEGGDLDPTLDAAQALRLLVPGQVLREETLYVRVLPGSGRLPAPGEYEPRELTATGSDLDGLAVLWAGVVVGPRLQLGSDTLARDADAEPVEHLARMYGMVAGELMWTQERRLAPAAPFDAPADAAPDAPSDAAPSDASADAPDEGGSGPAEDTVDVSGRLMRTAFATTASGEEVRADE